MNYSLSWSLGLPFSLFSWTLDMAFVNLAATKFGFPLKNWHMNMYHMHIWKNEQLPVLVPGVAVLVVSLDPRYGLCHSWNLWIWIPLEKVAYKHVHSSSNPKIKIFSNLLLRILGFSMRRCSCTLEINLSASKTSKFGFCLKNWPINMCIVPGCLSSADLEGGCKNAPPPALNKL